MPKNKTGKHLQFYIDCMHNGGIMPNRIGIVKGGLCLMVESGDIDSKLFNLFSDGQIVFQYWADESRGDGYDTRLDFNKLRQNIVLFMAAINNEL